MKACSKCSQVKPHGEFGTDRGRPDGLTSQCRACRRANTARWRAANPRAKYVPISERVWDFVDKSSGCWIWTAAQSSRGYGQLWAGGKSVKAHRYVWELVRGPVPAGLELDHLCRIPACVNPDHLEPVTHRENVRRGDAGKHVSAAAAQRTACRYGHTYDAENIYLDRKGNRYCQKCRRKNREAWRARSKRA